MLSNVSIAEIFKYNIGSVVFSTHDNDYHVVIQRDCGGFGNFGNSNTYGLIKETSFRWYHRLYLLFKYTNVDNDYRYAKFINHHLITRWIIFCFFEKCPKVGIPTHYSYISESLLRNDSVLRDSKLDSLING